MDVPEVHVQVPVVARGVLRHPPVEDGLYFFNRLGAAAAGVVDLVEARIVLVGGVPLAKGRDHRGVEAALLKLTREAVFFVGRLKAAVTALAFGVGGRAPVAHHPGVDAKAPLVKRGA